MLAVGDEDRGHLARRQRLDHFDSAGRLDLAVRDGDDVDASEIGPSYGDEDKGADDQDQSQTHRRSRRFKDFQVGRKEPAVGDDRQLSGRDHGVSRRGLLDLDHVPAGPLLCRQQRFLDRAHAATRSLCNAHNRA